MVGESRHGSNQNQHHHRAIVGCSLRQFKMAIAARPTSKHKIADTSMTFVQTFVVKTTKGITAKWKIPHRLISPDEGGGTPWVKLPPYEKSLSHFIATIVDDKDSCASVKYPTLLHCNGYVALTTLRNAACVKELSEGTLFEADASTVGERVKKRQKTTRGEPAWVSKDVPYIEIVLSPGAKIEVLKPRQRNTTISIRCDEATLKLAVSHIINQAVYFSAPVVADAAAYGSAIGIVEGVIAMDEPVAVGDGEAVNDRHVAADTSDDNTDDDNAYDENEGELEAAEEEDVNDEDEDDNISVVTSASEDDLA
jgi:hypothetical protein